MTIKNQVLRLHNKGYSISQISHITNISSNQIRNVYNKEKGFLVHRYDLIEIENDLIQLIIGSLLGDGSFTKPYNRGSKLSIAHTIDQKELIEFKLEILKKYNLNGQLCYNKIYSDRYINVYIEEYRFKSTSHPIFKYVRDNYYVNNEKSVVKEYLNLIDPLGFAIWYMDDGNITNHSYQFNTQSFSVKEKQLLQAKLRQFGVKTTLHKQGQIYILSESRDKFKEIIEPYMLDSMKYKLSPYKIGPE